MRTPSSRIIIAAILVAGCKDGALPTSIDNIQSQIHLSVLAGPGGPSAITALAMVKVGQSFTASFTTRFGGCDAAYDLTVETNGADSITLVPLNRRTIGEVCPDIVGLTTRSANLSFDTPGAKTIRALGFLEMPDGSLQLGSIQTTIEVTP